MFGPSPPHSIAAGCPPTPPNCQTAPGAARGSALTPLCTRPRAAPRGSSSHTCRSRPFALHPAPPPHAHHGGSARGTLEGGRPRLLLLGGRGNVLCDALLFQPLQHVLERRVDVHPGLLHVGQDLVESEDVGLGGLALAGLSEDLGGSVGADGQVPGECRVVGVLGLELAADAVGLSQGLQSGRHVVLRQGHVCEFLPRDPQVARPLRVGGIALGQFLTDLQ